jgi:hypothetical protein
MYPYVSGRSCAQLRALAHIRGWDDGEVGVNALRLNFRWHGTTVSTHAVLRYRWNMAPCFQDNHHRRGYTLATVVASGIHIPAFSTHLYV